MLVALLCLVIGVGIGYLGGTMSTEDREEPAMIRGMHDAMGGMMIGLDGKTGDALDKAFLDEMIVHHEGAIEMAQTLLNGTKRPELIKLGNEIIAAQSQEIKMMTAWRSTWFGQ